MSFLSPLPAEIRNKIIALTMPMGVTIALCKTGSPIATKQSPKHGESHPNAEKSQPQIVYRELIINGDKQYVYEDEQAQAYGALLLTNRTINQELAAQFYGSNNFAFPSSQFLQPFIRNLSTTTLSYLRTISLSIYLHETTWMWHPSREWNPIPDVNPLIKQLSCLRRCGNLGLLSIELEAQSCKVQPYVFDWFLSEGRKTIGLAPSIRVAFFFCEICTNSEKSQHWRWGSASGSHLWEVTNYIGSTPAQSLSQILAANPVSKDPALKASSIAKIKEIGASIKEERSCETCGGYPVGMPDDLRRSRGFWCKRCEMVFYCSAHAAVGHGPSNRSQHDDHCVGKPKVRSI